MTDRTGTDHASKLKGLIWLLGSALVAVVIAAGIPFLAKHIPWSAEKRMARSLGRYPDADACGISKNHESAELLAKLVKRIYPLDSSDLGIPLTVEVIHGGEMNAFASLGGHIYVFDELLRQAESPEELAGVLAHEIEHVRKRHIVQGMFARFLTAGLVSLVFSGSTQMSPQIANLLLNMKFSREQEEEADLGGLKRLQEAKVDPKGFQNFFARVETQSAIPAILSDHPATPSRAALVSQFHVSNPIPVLTHAEWVSLRGICR